MRPFKNSTRSSVDHKNSTPHSSLLQIEREFEVSISRLFEAFKTSEALKVWWWPQGLHADLIDIDFRKGGRYFINMKGHDQAGGGMTGIFEDIIENECIVMTDQFSDKNGHAISAQEAKMPGTWPEIIYITFDFESVSENKSRFLLSQEGIPNAMQKDCIQGWTESFDKLETSLAGRKRNE
ncbi:MAG: SRPBCC domain-containing protein [Bdellovibrionota bacterium]